MHHTSFPAPCDRRLPHFCSRRSTGAIRYHESGFRADQEPVEYIPRRNYVASPVTYYLKIDLIVICVLFCIVRQKKPLKMTTPVVIAATARHTATLIFFHGLGDTGHGWASSLGTLRPPHVKVICPTAPTMPVTLNGGFKMPSWFDLRTLDATGPEDEEGIRRAADTVHSMIAEEVAAGIPTERIMLGGFSQGGALALFSALTFPQPLAGVVALSTWLPLHAKFPGEMVGNKNTPILQCHGDCDPIVPYKWGQATATLLKQFLTNTEFRTYQGVMHTSSDEELRDIKDFIEKLLKP